MRDREMGGCPSAELFAAGWSIVIICKLMYDDS